MNYIFGGGVVALLAREILGSDWKIIPFGKSRYYSFQPALADDFIVYNGEHASIINGLSIARKPPLLIRDAFSIDGALLFQPLGDLKEDYLQRIFGEDPHPLGHQLLKLEFFIHSVNVSDLYKSLIDDYGNEMRDGMHKFGKVLSIKKNEIKTEKGTFEYDKIVNTIPLDILLGCLGKPNDLNSRDEFLYLIQTGDLNFEGARSLLVLRNIEFYKATLVDKGFYIFRSFSELGAEYFSLFLEDFQIVSSTHIEKSVPIGKPPDLKNLEDNFSIFCAGSNAQWDYFMDMASCINRIVKIAQL